MTSADQQIVATVLRIVARNLDEGLPLAGEYGAMEAAIVEVARDVKKTPLEVGALVELSLRDRKETR